ncbi:MAG TPA: hypothetical protein VKI62_08155, partial [Bacteroidota bacterium]|nr:hypothetical protein [Bacteroidota bacterium]
MRNWEDKIIVAGIFLVLFVGFGASFGIAQEHTQSSDDLESPLREKALLNTAPQPGVALESTI